MESFELLMHIWQGRKTPQGVFADFEPIDRDGPTSQTVFKTTIPPNSLSSIDFGKIYKLTIAPLEEED